MITLYGGGPMFGLPEVSPYATKTEVQLKMAGLPYRKAVAAPHLSPKGQLPFIDDGGERIADSTFIRQHLEWTYAVDLDAGLTPVERAQAWAIERMVENHFGWTIAPGRFLAAENFEKGPARWFDGAPEAMRPGLKADLLRKLGQNLMAVGVGRHSPAEVVDLGEASLHALSALIGDKAYLMGEAPTGTDAVTFAVLAGLLSPFFDTPLRTRAANYPNLGAYVDRMMTRFYPEHPWAREASAMAA